MTLRPQELPYSYVLPGLEARLSPPSPHIGGVWAPHLPPALTDLIQVVLGQKQSGSRCLWGKKKKLQKSHISYNYATPLIKYRKYWINSSLDKDLLSR